MHKINYQGIHEKTLAAVELQGSLLRRELSPKEIGIDSKVFHYWKMNGLLGTLEMGKWARVSYIEYMWLRVLETIRKFGCSLKLSQGIYHALFIKAYQDNLGELTLRDNIAFLTNLSKIRALEKHEQDILEQSKSVLADELLMMGLRTEISHFYQLILRCINQQVETGIVIYADESFAFHDGTKQVIDTSRPYLFIPFSHFIADIFHDESKDSFIRRIGLLSEQEMWIVKELRQNNVEKISISINKENGKITKIEYDSHGLIDGNKAKEVMKVLGMQNYSSMKISTRNGSSLSYVKTEKKIFR